MSRTRTKTGYTNTGYGELVSNTGFKLTSNPVQEIALSLKTVDDLSPGYPNTLRENPFTLTRQKVKLPRMSCKWIAPAGTWRVGAARSKRLTPYGTGQAWPVGSYRVPDLAYWETQAIARMNPNNPVVDVPLFLFELKDFPRMLRDLGRYKKGDLSSKDVPDSFLSYNFGWAPMVSDLRKLLALQASIDERIRSLAKRNHKRTRLRLNEMSFVENLGTTRCQVAPSVADCQLRHTRTTEERIWAVFDYTISELPDSSDVNPFLGFGGLSYATLWNALPWSWLIDYFSNVGTYLSTYRGTIPYRLENFNVMAHTKVTLDRRVVSHKPWYSNGVYSYAHPTDGRELFERKARLNSVVARPSLRLDAFLTDHQKAILGALAVSLLLRKSQ